MYVCMLSCYVKYISYRVSYSKKCLKANELDRAAISNQSREIVNKVSDLYKHCYIGIVILKYKFAFFIVVAGKITVNINFHKL